MRIYPYVAALLAMVLCTAAAYAQESTVDLRPLWQEGQTARYEFWTRVEQSATMTLGQRTQEIDATQTFTGEMTWVVDKVKPDGSTVSRMTLDWIAVTAERLGPDGVSTTTDTRRPAGDAPALHEMLSAMAGVPVTVELAPDGHVTKVSGTAAMRSKTKTPEVLPEDIDYEETASDAAALAFAPSALAVGGAFDATFRWSHELGFMHQDWTYTLADVQEMHGIDIATIRGNAKLRLEVDTSEMPAGAPPLSARLTDGSITTEILFDLSRYEVLARTSRGTENITVTVKLPENQTFTRRLEETTTSQLLRISEE